MKKSKGKYANWERCKRLLWDFRGKEILLPEALLFFKCRVVDSVQEWQVGPSLCAQPDWLEEATALWWACSWGHLWAQPGRMAPWLGKVCQSHSTGKWQHVYHVLAISGQDYGCQWLFQMSSLILHNFSLFSGKIFANTKNKKLFVPLCIFMDTVSLNYFSKHIPLASLFGHLRNPEYGPWPHPAECLGEKILNQVIIQITTDFFCDELRQEEH